MARRLAGARRGLGSWQDRAWLLAVAALAATLIVSFFNRYAIDDSFIGYSNAQNLAAGRGFAFNPGDRFLTTSAPLVVPIYAVLSLLSRVSVAELGQCGSAAAILAVALGAYCFLKPHVGAAGAFAGVAVLFGSPTFTLLWSHETLIWAAFTVWALVALARERYRTCGLLLACALLSRPETALTLLLLALWSFRTKDLRASLELVICACTPYAVWLAYSWVHFGTFVSQSAFAKHAQLLLEGYPYLEGLFVSPGHTYGIFIGRFGELTFAFAIASIAIVARSKRWRGAYSLFGVWVLATTLAYAAAGTHFFAWYGLQVPATMVFAAAIPWAAPRADSRKPYVLLSRIFAGILVAMHLVVFGVFVFSPQSRYNIDDDFVMPRFEDNGYEHLGVWLRDHSKTTDSVAYPEIGQLRYYSGRRIVSTDGLATPGVAKHILEFNGMWVFERYRPEIVVDEPLSWISTLDVREEEWFPRAYAAREHLFFPDPVRRDNGRDTFVIDHLIDPSAIPPAAEIDVPARSSLTIRDGRAGLHAEFTAGTHGIARIEVRVDTRVCRVGVIVLHGPSVAVSRHFTTRSTLPFERLNVDAGSPAVSPGPYRLDIRGCGVAALAPPRYRRDAFSWFPRVELESGEPKEAIEIFKR